MDSEINGLGAMGGGKVGRKAGGEVGGQLAEVRKPNRDQMERSCAGPGFLGSLGTAIRSVFSLRVELRTERLQAYEMR